jgi:carbamoyl-phosphate synthase large subunit
MHNIVTVLFASAGRRIQLIECFRADAARLGLRLRTLAAELRPDMSPACQFVDSSFRVPRCTAPEYIPALLEICARESVHLLVPTIDTELAVFSASRDAFAAIGTRVLISSPSVVALAGDKLATSSRLAEHGISTSRALTLREYRSNPQSLNWPVIAKPNSGSASAGIIRPASAEDLDRLEDERYIVQELWEGLEYTVNIFFSQDGALRCAVPHLRIEVRSGEVSKGRTERVPMLEDAARRLAPVLPGAQGPLCFQAIITAGGQYALFEINARFGGGYPLAHHAGARMSQWLLEEVCGLPISAHNDWTSGITMLRFDQAVFTND